MWRHPLRENHSLMDLVHMSRNSRMIRMLRPCCWHVRNMAATKWRDYYRLRCNARIDLKDKQNLPRLIAEKILFILFHRMNSGVPWSRAIAETSWACPSDLSNKRRILLYKCSDSPSATLAYACFAGHRTDVALLYLENGRSGQLWDS